MLPGMGVPGSGFPACDRKGNEDGGAREAAGGVSNGLVRAAEDERRRCWLPERIALPADPTVVARGIRAGSRSAISLSESLVGSRESGTELHEPLSEPDDAPEPTRKRGRGGARGSPLSRCSTGSSYGEGESVRWFKWASSSEDDDWGACDDDEAGEDLFAGLDTVR